MESKKSSKGNRLKRYIAPDDGLIIPTWIKFGRRINCVNRASATHMLVDVEVSRESLYEGVANGALVAVRRYGEGWVVRICRIGPFTCYYMDINTATQKMGSILKRFVSMIYSRVSGITLNSGSIWDYLEIKFDMTDLPKIKNLVTDIKYIRDKISAEHHTHLRPKEVYEIAENAGARKKLLAAYMVQRLYNAGINAEATVATFMMYVIGADERIAWLVLKSGLLWKNTHNAEELLARIKTFQLDIKAAHLARLEPLTQLFELSVLLNRGMGKVSWEDERQHRQQPNTTNVTFDQVYKSAKKVFSMAIKQGYQYPRNDWDGYVKTRWEWIPGGSVHSQYEDDQEYIIGGQHTRNKFVTINLMPANHIKSFPSSPPEIRAWTSTKYEWGKQRAIYGTDLRSTIITNLAMYRCEEVLLHLFPVGEQAEVEKVHKRISMMLNGYDSFCFDYDDFNSQHSISSMQAVLVAFLDAFSYKMSSDQREAMEWVILSVANMMVLDPHNRKWYQLQGTLLSGWRLTTFMNTVLNWVYMDIAGVFNIDGIHDSVHNGDDVMLSVSTVKAAVIAMAKMDKINARAQPEKCNLLSIAEFLRIEHGMNGSDGLGAQYLTRSCATLVHSRIESREPITLTRLLEADKTRIKDFENRCGDKLIISELQKSLNKRAAKIFYQDEKVCDEIQRLHRVCGGINDYRWADVDNVVQQVTSGYDIPEEVDDPSLWPGVNDYAYDIYTKLKEQVGLRQIVLSVAQGSKMTIAYNKRVNLRVVRNDREFKLEWERALYKTYKKTTISYFGSLAKFLNIPPLSLVTGKGKWGINAALESSDTLRALRLLF